MGIPTAHPTISPTLLLDPELLEEVFVPAALAVGSADGVITFVSTMVETPAGPEETLVTSEVIGEADEGGAEDEAGWLDEAGALVFEAELPLPVPVAWPVKEASVGALDAWLRPIVAYGLPS
jgi:hypothetical protein